MQRQRELENVKTTLARLNEQAVYLEQQLKTYNDYIEQAMVTLQNKNSKKRKIIIQDSDEETQDVDSLAFNKGLSAYQPSPEPKQQPGRLIKYLLFRGY